MKKSIIALFALTSSYVYATEVIGTVVGIESSTILEECYTCNQIDENNFNYDIVTDLHNDIVSVKTSDNKIHVFKIESKYGVKAGQKIAVEVDSKETKI